MNDEYIDDELEAAVKDLIHNSHKIDGRDLSVSVKRGELTLSGSVKAQEERDYALSIAELIQGIGSIRSDIIVKTTPGILPTDIGRHS